MLTLARSPEDKFAGAYETSETRYATFLLAKILCDGAATPVQCRVSNISAGGLMAVLPAGASVSGHVEIRVRHAEPLTGEIAWSKGGEIGVRFDEQIDPVKLLADRAEGERKLARQAHLFVEASRSKLQHGAWSDDGESDLPVPLVKH